MATDEPTPSIDTIRARWRRWREGERLVDPREDEFATGGSLSRLTPKFATRLLILPADPETHVVDFDGETWEWWALEFDDPATDGKTQWGHSKVPTANAAVVGNRYSDSEWDRYIALYRNGGIEIALGSDGSRVHHEEKVFHLTTIVARCWAGISRFRAVVNRFSLQPPFEVSLALRGTEGALLGDLAEGWAGPGSAWNETGTCPEPNLLLRRELAAWPDGSEELRAIAFSLGAQIEDAWGATQRRFLAYRGDYKGAFDPRPARW